MMEGKVRYVVVAIIWVATLSAVLVWALSTQETRLSIAAGPRSGESFQLASAIAQVFNDAATHTSIDVFETSGSAENVRLLEAGQVDFATVQADTRVDDTVNAVASLYFDAYQLIVNASSDIQGFEDLKGYRVAIGPANSGQNGSFWFVAQHYGLSSDQLVALPMSEDAANFAMIMGQVYAVFRVRAPGNLSIRELVRDHPMRLVPIQQSEALSLKRPAISTGVIPLGSYRGSPPLPVSDQTTTVLERLLVARADLDADLVFALTHILFEHRSELIALNNLAGFISAIDSEGRISMPLHPGARRYYDREKPDFWQQNTRILASLLYVVALLTSAALALRSHLMRRRKVRIGHYNMHLMEIAEQARHTPSSQTLYELKDQLVNMLQQVVQDLDKERVTQEEFEHFSFTWQAVDTMVRDSLSLAGHPMARGDPSTYEGRRSSG
jgi:TRAP transporter TAXI family solute receptor